MSTDNILGGKRVLLVEDDFFIVMQMVQDLEKSGAQVIGPVPTVAKALDHLEKLSDIEAAILDINLQGEPVFAVAEELRRRGVPFVFASGYDDTVIPSKYSDVPLLQKPVDAGQIASVLLGMQSRPGITD